MTTPGATAPLTVVHPAQQGTTTGVQSVAGWLREQRKARGWSRPMMARKIIKLAHSEGGPRARELLSAEAVVQRRK